MNKKLKLKPLIIEAREAHASGQLNFESDGTAILKVDNIERKISKDHQYDLVPATIFGLNERLTLSATSPVVDPQGNTLRDLFNNEWEKYESIMLQADVNKADYGYYAYYHTRGDLVRYCPPFWHHLVAIASNSKLLSDQNNDKTWQEIRNILKNTVVSITGCSVGSSVTHSLIMDLRPANIKVSDKSVFKMENINRMKLSYGDIVASRQQQKSFFDPALKNKAQTLAEQIYSIDPYINVYVYDEGINGDNIDQYISGSDDEPAVDIMIDEVDDPRIKILLRQEARKRKIPLLMVTDIGSCIQLDILRYDKKPDLSLTYNTNDTDLIQKMEDVYENAGNRKVFFEFVDALIGTDYRQDELQEIIIEKTEIPTSTIIPQLGSTVAVAGGIAAEAVARIRLGYDYPSRVIINKKNFSVKIFK